MSGMHRRIYLSFFLLILIVVPILAQEATQEPLAPTDFPTSIPTTEPSLTPLPSVTPIPISTAVPIESPSNTPFETATIEANATDEPITEFGTSFSAMPEDNPSALATNLAYIADFETSSLPEGTIRDTAPVLFGFPNPSLIGGGINNPNVNGLYASTSLRNQSTPVTVHMSVQVDLGGQPRQITNLFRWGIAWRSNFALTGKVFNGYLTFEDANGAVIAQSTICAIQATAPTSCVVSIDLSKRNVYSVTAHLEAPNMTASGTNFVEWGLDNVYVPTTSIYVPPSPSPVPTEPSCGGAQEIGIQQTCVPKADLLVELDTEEELQLRQIGQETTINITVSNQNFNAQGASPSIAGNVQVNILLPVGLSFVTSSSPDEGELRIISDGILRWDAGTLFPEGGDNEPQSKTLNLVLRVEADAISSEEGLSGLLIDANAESNTIEFNADDNRANLVIEAVHPYCRYVIARGNARTYRAPITNNPPNYPVGSTDPVVIAYSPSYNYIINAISTDYAGEMWYRVTAVIVSNAVATPGNYIELYTEDTIEGEGIDSAGFWIKDEEVVIGDSNCQSAIMDLSPRYSVPNISWQNSTAFNAYPVNLSDLCTSGHLDIDSLGINPANVNRYPRQVHNGIDFYVPEGIHAQAMADGLVVGIGYAEEVGRTHAIWGASTLTSNMNNNTAYAIIIRHGHFYVLYGHLQEIPDNIWVGASVSSGQDLGLIGEFNTRHLHVEIHSFGELTSTAPAYDPNHEEFDAPLDPTGILPVGGQGRLNVPPYVYDVLQLLPPFPNYTISQLNRVNLTQVGMSNEYQITLNIDTCTLLYRTDMRPPVVDEFEIAPISYRGFVSFSFLDNELGNEIVSPLRIPSDR